MALKHPFPATVFKSHIPGVISGISSLLLTAAVLNAPAHAQSTSVSATIGGKKVNYTVISDWVAFQVKSSTTPKTTIAGLSTQAGLDLKAGAMTIGTDVVALRVATSASAYDKNQLSARLKKATSIQRQLRVFGTVKNPIIETPDAIVNFAAGVTDAQKKTLLNKQGAILVGAVGNWSPGSYRVRVSSTNAYATNVANGLLQAGAAKWAEPDLAMRMVKRATTNDAFFAAQWHLNNTGNNSGIAGLSGADIDALKAWDISRGSGAKICINDDGVDIDHEDLKDRVIASSAFGDASTDVRPPTDDDNHGTSVAGLALATGNNSIGVSGAAPEASLIAVRIPLGTAIANSAMAESITWPIDQGADIVSCSWGPPSDSTEPVASVLGDAFDYAIESGRDGKGAIVMFAAGNDDTVSLNGIDNDPRILHVAASNRMDVRSEYSNFGTTITFAAPGGYGRSRAGDMVTTDRTGAKGYDPSNYNREFNGTSAATPVAAGVTALVIATNPGLTRQQIINVLTSTAEKIDRNGGAYDGNGFSKYYGYGRLNAFNAVAAAKALLGGTVTITTPVSGTEYDRGELTEATGTGDERTASVNVGLVKTDKSGKRLAYLNFENGEWVTLATTTTSVGMYAADYDDAANKWQKDIPSDVLGGGYYQFLAQGYTAAAIPGAVVTSSFKVDSIDVSVSSPTINTKYSSGTASDTTTVFARATGTVDEDASGVDVALIKKNSSGQSVYQWDFSAANQAANNWIPLNRDTMMNPAIVDAPAGGKADWRLAMPAMAAGQYEVRVQGRDMADVQGEITTVPFTVVDTDGTPENVSLTPASVKVAAGKAVAFKATYRHSISVSKLKFLSFRAQMGEGDSATIIEARYDIANNVVSIYDTASARWVNGYKPGTKVTLASTTAGLNVRQCAFAQPKPKKGAVPTVTFTFSIIPRISGTYITAIRCGTESVSSAWENKGVMTVTAGKSVNPRSAELSDSSS